MNQINLGIRDSFIEILASIRLLKISVNNYVQWTSG